MKRVRIYYRGLSDQRVLGYIIIIGDSPNSIGNNSGPYITTIMELGSQNHLRGGLVGPNSKIEVFMDSLGIEGANNGYA